MFASLNCIESSQDKNRGAQQGDSCEFYNSGDFSSGLAICALARLARAAGVLRTQSSSGAWLEGYIGPVYTTSINATILQLENGFLPIYQR